MAKLSFIQTSPISSSSSRTRCELPLRPISMFSGLGLVGTQAISIFSTRFCAFYNALLAPPPPLPDAVYDVFNLLLLFQTMPPAMGGLVFRRSFEAEFQLDVRESGPPFVPLLEYPYKTMLLLFYADDYEFDDFWIKLLPGRCFF